MPFAIASSQYVEVFVSTELFPMARFSLFPDASKSTISIAHPVLWALFHASAYSLFASFSQKVRA
jgi:hypothetical protein